MKEKHNAANKIVYGVAETEDCLRQILDLQERNLSCNVSQEEIQSEGYVTVQHSFDLLKRMNEPYGHIVARRETDGRIVGYTLILLRELGSEIELLDPMFDRINSTEYHQKHPTKNTSTTTTTTLADTNYFVMGQVCIDKAFRGKGIFGGLYQEMKRRMAPHFDLILTLVSRNNPRSLRAHAKVGFQTILDYEGQGHEHWELIGWSWD